MNRLIWLLLAPLLATSNPAAAEATEPMIGEIQFVGFDFAPPGWARCDGALLSISSNQALFSILGTTYGGDGRSTFALPDMRGRIPIHVGHGPGLQNRVLGERAGSETNTLSTTQIPAHTHTLMGYSSSARTTDPFGNAVARTRSNLRAYDSASATNPADAPLAAEALGTTGSGSAVNNMHPYQSLNCIIALVGIFPPRN